MLSYFVDLLVDIWVDSMTWLLHTVLQLHMGHSYCVGARFLQQTGFLTATLAICYCTLLTENLCFEFRENTSVKAHLWVKMCHSIG